MASRVRLTQINLHRCHAAALATAGRNVGPVDATHPSPPSIPHSDIFLIQEPYCFHNRITSLPRGQLFAVHKDQIRPRACIWTSSNCSASLIPELSDPDMVTIESSWRSQKIVFASVYMPHDSNAHPNPLLDELAIYCATNRLPLIVGADCNSHHSAWGSSDINLRGSTLLEFILSRRLIAMNIGSKPTFVTSNRSEVIDITLANELGAKLIQNWHVSDNESLSDHKYLCFEVSATKPSPLVKRNIRKMDTSIFLSKLEELAPTLPIEVGYSSSSIDEAANQLQKVIQIALEVSCPLKPVGFKQSNPWWTTELTEMRKNLRRDQRAPGNDLAFKQRRNAYFAAVRKAKRNPWRDFCSEVEDLPQTSRIYRILGKFSQPLERIKVNDRLTRSTPETLEALLDAHFPGNVAPSVWDMSPRDEAYITSNVTPESTQDAIMKFQPFRSPGPDGFPPYLLQLGRLWLTDTLCALFRACLITGYVPYTWRVSKVVFIPKLGKKDYEQASSWRPISLMCFTLKILERLVDKMIRTRVLISTLKQNHQFAYIEGGSTEAALHRLIGYLEKNKMEKRPSLVAFIDVQGAFNDISREAIIEGMVDLEVNPTITRWVDNCLGHRVLTTTIKDSTATKSVSNGCPQGSCGSPIYWDVALNGLLKKLRDKFPFLLIQAYADDICIAASGVCTFTMRDQIRCALTTIRHWCSERGLTLNVDKTELLWVDSKRKPIHPSIKIDGKVINVASSVRYIGVWIDRHLNWNTHVRNKTADCIKKLVMCQRAIGRVWGLRPALSLWLYKAVIRPCLDYGSLVWVAGTEVALKRALLEKVQRLALLMTSGACRTTPTAGLEAVLNVPPVDIFLKGQAMRSWRRLVRTNTTCSYTNSGGHLRWIQSHVKSVALTEIPPSLSDHGPRTHIGNKRYTCTIASRLEWENKERTVKEAGITCYTDGSLIKDEISGQVRTGCGVVIITHSPVYSMSSSSFHLGSMATVYDCEMDGIRRAAQQLLSLGVKGQEISIYCDNQSCIRTLIRNETTSRLAVDTYHTLQQVGSSNNLTLEWIPGHSNYHGNETADHFAGLGCFTNYETPEPFLPLRESVINMEIRKWMESMWRNRWRNSPTCRLSKFWVPRPRISNRSPALSFQRQALSLLVGIITGHTRVRKHLFTIGVSPSPLCECGSEESPAHVVADCPIHVMNRLLHLQQAIIHETELKDLNYQSVLSFFMATGTIVGSNSKVLQGTE